MKTTTTQNAASLSLGTSRAQRLRLTPQPACPPCVQDRPITRWTGRVVDLAIASAMLTILAVPMLVIAALVKLTSRGPALYRQQRIGLKGRPFVIYKFRTMGMDAEVQTGPVWAKRSDPRCTLVGNLLRRWCIDELPQLFNVLRGDMSLVGPRPERPYFVREFSQQYAQYPERHDVLPGMTGWAQINGWRGDSSLEKRLEYDLYYVRNWTVLFNLKIILLTPVRLLFDRQGG